MKVTLKDGSVKEYAGPMSVIDIAADISPGLARMACGGEIALLLLVLTYVASSTYNPFIYFNF